MRAVNAGSAQANVVFFADAHEAYRQNVARLLRGDRAGEWFWPQATGVPVDLATPVRVEQLLERWQLLPPGWAGVARELVPALDSGMASTLLQSIVPRTAARWLGAEGPLMASDDDATPRIQPQAKRLLHDLQLHFEDTSVTSGHVYHYRLRYTFGGRQSAPSNEVAVDGIGDSDHDGLTDLTELLLGTNPFNADSDGDGLSDGDEISHGTDPHNADSDDDGVNDGEEITTHLNPLVKDNPNVRLSVFGYALP